MSRLRISQKAYDNYEDAVVTLFMEHYAAALTESLEAETVNTEKTPFPKELDERCRKLIKKKAAKQVYLEILKATKRVLKSAAVFALVVLAVTSVLFMSVRAFREHVVNYYISRGEGYWSLTSDQHHTQGGTSHTVMFNKDDPLQGLIPTDYVLKDISNADDRRITALYENPAGEYIRFVSLPYTASLLVDMENADSTKEITIAENNAIVTIKNGVTQIVWINESTSMTYLIVANQITEEDLYLIAEQMILQINK